MDINVLLFWFGIGSSVGVLVLGVYILRYGQPKNLAILMFFLGLFCFQYAFFAGIRDRLNDAFVLASTHGQLPPAVIDHYLIQIQGVALISLTGGPLLLACLIHFCLTYLFPFCRWDRWVAGFAYGVAGLISGVFIWRFNPIGDNPLIRYDPNHLQMSIASTRLVPIYLITCAVFLVFLIAVLIVKSLRCPPVYRKQFRLMAMLLSINLALVSVFSALLPAFGYLEGSRLGRSGFLFFFLGLYVSITRFRAFQIRTAVHYTVYWVLVSIAAVVPVWIGLWWALYFFPVLEFPVRSVAFFGITCIVVSVVVFQVYWVQPRINQWFFKRRHQLENELVLFTDRVAIQHTVDGISGLIQDTLTRCLYPERVDVVLAPSMPSGTPSMTEIPMVVGEIQVGTIRIGDKKTLKPYSQDELTFVRRVAHQSAIHLNNAILIDTLTQKNLQLIALQDDLLRSERDRVTLAQTQQHTQALARGIIHEVKNAHFAIRSFISVILEDRLQSPMDVKSVLSVIGEQSSKLFLFSTNYLHQELIKSQLFFIKPSQVLFADLVADAIQLNHFFIETHALKITMDGDDGQWIWVDRDKFLLVVSNFINNAARHVQFNTLDISIKSETDRIYIRFLSRLRPDGAGALDDTGAALHGTGFGLRISRYIVECHGGTMTDSRDADRFIVDLGIPRPAIDHRAPAAPV